MNDLAPRFAAFDRLMRALAAETLRLEGVPEEMRALHDEYTAERLALDQLAADAEQAATERGAREVAVADAQEKLRKFQQQVPKVRNQREYGALLSEIDGAKSSLRTLDDGALEAFERAETLSAELAQREVAFVAIAERHAAALADWEVKKPAVAARVRDLSAEVEASKRELPRAMVAQYGRVSVRYKGDVLTTVRRVERAGGSILWHCSTCNYQLRSQLAVEIRSRGAVVECDSCRRFLIALDQLP